MAKATIQSCLADIGVDTSTLKSLAKLEDEFALIKKAYFKKIILVHPDKGGDSAVFRKVNEAFEALREMYEKKTIASFATAMGKKAEAKVQNLERSWDYYNDAFDVNLPIYKVELARSARSKCNQKTKSAKKCTSEEIDKGEVRIGSIDMESGSYARWVHLMCWRVPSRIWLGLPNPDACTDKARFEEALSSMNEVLFTGFDSLSPQDKSKIIDHVMDKSNWAKLRHRSGPAVIQDTKISNDIVKEETSVKGLLTGSSKDEIKNELIPIKQELKVDNIFKMPVKTSKNQDYLAGKTIVVTGVFPEVGGGAGLNLGKDKVKSMIADFGGRVTSALSGKTDYLIVGKEPGFSKVSKARSHPKCQLLSLDNLKNAIESANPEFLENIPPLIVDTFSTGYYGTSTLAIEASSRELEIARGLVEPPLQILPGKSKAGETSAVAKKSKATKKSKASKKDTKEQKEAKHDAKEDKKKDSKKQVKEEPKEVVKKEKEKATKRKLQENPLPEISGMKEEEAVEFLSSRNWDLEVSINEFFNSESLRQRKPVNTPAKGEEETNTKKQESQASPVTATGVSWMDYIRKGINSMLWILKWTLTLIIGKDELKRITGEEFKRIYEREFGGSHPEFFQGSYSQVLEKGKREAKWVLIALYVPDHPGNRDFCRNVISSTQLSSFIRQKKGIFWMGDTRTEEGLKVLQVLSVTKHPFLAVVGPQNSKMVVFDRIQGDYTIQETIYRLSQIITKIEPFLQGIREERVTRQADRSIREQQDEAYQASLKADQEKDRIARLQKEEKEKQERLELEEKTQKLQKVEEKKKRREELKKNLPQEPQDVTQNITKLSIRLPSGQRIIRKFTVKSTIRQLYEFVETQELDPLTIESDFIVAKTFPRVVLQDLDATLESCGLLPTGSLIVEEKL